HPPDRPLRPDQMILPDDVAQLRRPQPVRERPRRLAFEQGAHRLFSRAAGLRRFHHDADPPPSETRNASPRLAATRRRRRNNSGGFIRYNSDICARRSRPNTPSNVSHITASTFAIVAATPSAATDVTP